MPALARTMSTAPSSRTPAFHRGLQCIEVTHIRLRCDDPAVERFDLLDRLSQVLRCRHGVRHCLDLSADVNGNDVRALLRQSDRVTTALTTRRAGDEGDPCRPDVPLKLLL